MKEKAYNNFFSKKFAAIIFYFFKRAIWPRHRKLSADTDIPCIIILSILCTLLPHQICAQQVKINDLVIDMSGYSDPGNSEESDKDKQQKNEKKWIVQFTGPILELNKNELLGLGCRIHDYLPDFAYIVTMDNETKKKVDKLSFIQGIAKYKPEHKIRKKLQNKIGKKQHHPYPSAKIDAEIDSTIHIRIDSPSHLSNLMAEIHRIRGIIVEFSNNLITAKIPVNETFRIAEREEVIWIEEAIPLQLLNDTSKWTIQTYIPDNTKIWDKGIHGEGQIIGIGDTGLDYDMPWFRDPENHPIGPAHRKIIGYADYKDDYDGDFGHGTHVAGTIAGDREPVDGLTTANGMAPKAKIFIQDISPGEERSVYPPADLGEMFIVPYLQGAHFHSDSWGSINNIYNTYARSADLFMWEYKDFLAFFANGNSGAGEGSVGTPATAKNVVSVGASENGLNAENVAGFSSNGPTADGRIKPTITAPGVAVVSADSDGLKNSYNSGTTAFSGTSMATPTATGAAALIRQYYVDGYWPTGLANPAESIEPSAALVKATLVNCAQNMTGDFIDNPIPSTGQGWGRINLANSLHFFSDNNFLNVEDNQNGLSTGTTWNMRYYVTGSEYLKVTLVWTDYPGMEGASKALVNDLNLLVTTPRGTTYRGNFFEEGVSVTGGAADELNVVEQVYIPAAIPGLYTVEVKGYNIPFAPQPFAVVVSGAVHISSTGSIDLDKSKYNDQSIVKIQVIDRDLNTSRSAADNVFITILSSTEPEGEVVELTENGIDTSIFTGEIPTAHGPAAANNGYLEIVEGDTINARYNDADDGTGHAATALSTAYADLTPPDISEVTVNSVDQDKVTVSWESDEPVTVSLSYGQTTDNILSTQTSSGLMTSPVVHAINLQENSTYFFKVSSTDEAGNTREDDNNGLYYSFVTLNQPPDLTLYSSNLTETYATETLLFGSAVDPSGITLVMITGDNLYETVPCRSEDGYYELRVSLAVGQNSFTVTATDTLGNVQDQHISIIRHEQPDLEITSITIPDIGGFAQPLHMENILCNNGPGVSPGTGFITWYLSLDDEISSLNDTKLMKEYYLGDDILPGECIYLAADIRLSLPVSLVWNSYYLGVFIDSRGGVWETDETNNILLAENRLTLAGADLAMTSLSGPTHVDPGESFPVSSTVQNIGLGTSLSFELDIYLSPDPNISEKDIKIGERYVYPLEPVGSPYPYPSESSDETEVLVQSTVPEGMYYLGAIAAPGDTFYEPDKLNNIFLGEQIQVGANQGPPAIDTPDTDPPSIPKNLAIIELQPGTILLTWDAAADKDGLDAVGYKIYRNGIEIGTTTKTSFTDVISDPATTFYYQIVAFDAAGNISGLSNTITISITHGPATNILPPAILNLLLRPGHKR